MLESLTLDVHGVQYNELCRITLLTARDTELASAGLG
jgi:hypothetical protein